MGYNCCFFLNFVPLHIESPYNFGGIGPILRVKNPLQRVNGHAVKIAHFVLIGLQTWPPHAILVSDWSISKKSSPLKLLSHMNQNLVGSIYMYGRFCIKFPQSRMKGERHRLSPLSL
jgi:hypothetical protein